MKSLEQIKADEREHREWKLFKDTSWTPRALMSDDRMFHPETTWEQVIRRQPLKTQQEVLRLLKDSLGQTKDRIAIIEGIFRCSEGKP